MLNDMDFIKTCDVPGPTKEAIRAIILYKSAVTPNDEVVDGVSERGGFPVVQKKMIQILMPLALPNKTLKNLIWEIM